MALVVVDGQGWSGRPLELVATTASHVDAMRFQNLLVPAFIQTLAIHKEWCSSASGQHRQTCETAFQLL